MAGLKGPRKLLVASIGVATINYVLAGCDSRGQGTTSGNLPAPMGGEPGVFPGGNGGNAGNGGKGNAGTPPTVANLPFPEPMGGFPPIAGSAGQNNAGTGGSGNEAGGGGESAGGSGSGGAP